MIKYISLDLQGTLSNSNYSDNFWLNILPEMYSKKFDISIELSKEHLKNKFQEYGLYNLLYYDDNYWANYLDFNTEEVLNKSDIKPELNKELYNFICKLDLPKIIISTTTNLFINMELKEKIKIFEKTYSCVDDFKMGGKTKKIYETICKELNIAPNEMLHIGDNELMDMENAKKAGIQTILYNGNVEKTINEIKEKLEVR